METSEYLEQLLLRYEETYDTVSYTHLDVYKRQILIRGMQILRKYKFFPRMMSTRLSSPIPLMDLSLIHI